MSLLHSLKNIILDIYIIIPFVFALIIGAFGSVKNPIYLRRLSILFSSVQFVFASALYLCVGAAKFSLLNISFNFDKFSSILIFVVSFIFLLISVISKTFILKSHKAFWTVTFLVFGLINTALLSDNILVYILNLIWMVFLGYFLSTTFAYSKDYKKDINSQLKLDVGIIAISCVLILFDFLRYFLLNDIEFCFSNITDNLYHINPVSSKIAFWGFLILNLKLFNLIPFTCKNISNSPKINPLIVYINLFVQLVAGIFLFFKTNTLFAYLYWDYQEIIICYMLFNLVYYLILSVRLDSIYRFLTSIIIVNFIVNLFSVFVFSEKGLDAFVYSSIATVISFSLMYFVLALLSDKFKTDKFDEFKKISPKNRKTIFFVIFSVLNFAGVPLLTMFFARFQVLLVMFGVAFEDIFYSIIPYIIAFACLFISLISFGVFHDLLVAPVDLCKNTSELSRHQIFVLSLLCFCVMVIGLCVSGISGGIVLNI